MIRRQPPVDAHDEDVPLVAEPRDRQRERKLPAFVRAERLAVEPDVREIAHAAEAQGQLEAIRRRRVEAPLVPHRPELVAHARQLVVPAPRHGDRRRLGHAGRPALRQPRVVRIEADPPDPGQVVRDAKTVCLRPQHARSISFVTGFT